MSNGWKHVASLGTKGALYPHVLVDNHGWCLRLGSSPKQDDKYYSSFPNLLQGLVEHFLRRRLKSLEVLEGFEMLAREVRDAIREVHNLSMTACEGVLQQPIRRSGSRGSAERTSATTGPEALGRAADRSKPREPVPSA